jgi:hypothetical protein
MGRSYTLFFKLHIYQGLTSSIYSKKNVHGKGRRRREREKKRSFLKERKPDMSLKKKDEASP